MKKKQYESPSCVILSMSDDAALLAGSPGLFDQVSDAAQLAKPSMKGLDKWGNEDEDDEEDDDSTPYVWGLNY